MKLDFTGVKILVVGDPINDLYVWGRVERISPEAPVPVFIEDDMEGRDGGAANVAAQLRALGCQVEVGWGLPISAGAWTRKTRYMVGSHQCFRVDFDTCTPNYLPALDGFSAAIISDYAKGACTPEVCQEVILEANRLGIPTIVDPKGKGWLKYFGCTVICPNEKELSMEPSEWYGIGATVVHKRGANGIDLLTMPQNRVNYPATAKHVFDVTGAGDTVTAVIAACLAIGMSVEEACPIANAAAGYVVGEVGTTVCPIEKLRELCS